MNARIDSRLTSKSIPFNEVPVVDIGALVNDGDVDAVAGQLREICQNIGFLYIENHGIPDDLIARMYTLTKTFFALPQLEKDALRIEKSGPTLRGYIPAYGENVDPENTRDLKEVFDFGQHGVDVAPFKGPNPMPESLPEVRLVFEEYHRRMVELARQLIHVVARSLDLPADYFDHKLTNPISIQRVCHYPPQFGDITQEEIGIGAHSDYGFLTILAQDSVGGLQAQNCDGEWISIPPVDGTFVVNIGDFLETFTNGRYVSTMHRVINTAGVDRYSIAFFMDMDFDAVVEPVPTCRDEAKLTDYPAYVCGEHKYRRFVDSYAHLQQTGNAS